MIEIKASKKNWIKFGIASLLYLLMVLWIGSFWLLLGLPLVFDIYITKKIPYISKTQDKKPGFIAEWLDAIIFALVAVYIINLFFFQNYKIPTSSLEKSLLVGDFLFVSKLSYGPRMPNTPLAFPLVQNTFPIINTKSYTEWPKWDYKRLTGFGKIKHNDIVVFNFAAGDTIAELQQNPDIYNLSRDGGRYMVAQNPNLIKGKTYNSVWEQNQFLMSVGRSEIAANPQIYGKIMYRPVDRRENYVKRCVALPGDTFEIRHNQIYINGIVAENPKNIQHNYQIITDGTPLSNEFFSNFGISDDDKKDGSFVSQYYLPLTSEKAAQLNQVKTITHFELTELQPDSTGMSVFPYSADYPWSRDNYGPLWIPKKGATVDINMTNLVIYDRVITAYEGNKLEVKNNQIYINDKLASTYTFKMDYYFMLGDNRHKSADARYWGFVPEDHVVGSPVLVWLSLDKDKSFPMNIRWNRFFKMANSN